jgi:hypothetical protein
MFATGVRKGAKKKQALSEAIHAPRWPDVMSTVSYLYHNITCYNVLSGCCLLRTKLQLLLVNLSTMAHLLAKFDL